MTVKKFNVLMIKKNSTSGGDGERPQKRFHDHHLSGTGRGKEFKKKGGGGHNWGKDLDISTNSLDTSFGKTSNATTTTDTPTTEHQQENNNETTTTKEETKVEDKATLRKRRKDQEKKIKKTKIKNC